jgi:hypothetical protein
MMSRRLNLDQHVSAMCQRTGEQYGRDDTRIEMPHMIKRVDVAHARDAESNSDNEGHPRLALPSIRTGRDCLALPASRFARSLASFLTPAGRPELVAPTSCGSPSLTHGARAVPAHSIHGAGSARH